MCVAQVLMGMPSARRFLRGARRQLGHLFPYLPRQDALHKRGAKLAETLEWLVGIFAAQSPGSGDSLLLLDSAPVECGRSLETTRRSQLADVCGYSYSKSHSRWFWGMRLQRACAPDGTFRSAALDVLVSCPLCARARPAAPASATPEVRNEDQDGWRGENSSSGIALCE
jgi:hypothetical protein